MKKKRFTEEQIIGILREHEAGAKAGDLARKYAVSETTCQSALGSGRLTRWNRSWPPACAKGR